MRFEEVYAPYDPGAEVLSQYDNMLAVDTSKWFCNADGDCPVIIGNIMVYRDMHHFTKAFADSAIPLIREAIAPILNGEQVKQQPPQIPADSPVIPQSAETPPATPAEPIPYPAYPAGEAI